MRMGTGQKSLSTAGANLGCRLVRARRPDEGKEQAECKEEALHTEEETSGVDEERLPASSSLRV